MSEAADQLEARIDAAFEAYYRRQADRAEDYRGRTLPRRIGQSMVGLIETLIHADFNEGRKLRLKEMAFARERLLRNAKSDGTPSAATLREAEQLIDGIRKLG